MPSGSGLQLIQAAEVTYFRNFAWRADGTGYALFTLLWLSLARRVELIDVGGILR
jgi:hypothetical protein